MKLNEFAKAEEDGRVKLIAKSATPNNDGYDVTTIGNLPFHIHPRATPKEWALIAPALNDSSAYVQPYAAPTLSPADLIALGENAIQQALDAGARAWGYDSLLTATSYANSTNAQFKAEAEALIGWRDNVWQWARVLESGTLPSSIDNLLAQMPAQPNRPVIQ